MHTIAESEAIHSTASSHKMTIIHHRISFIIKPRIEAAASVYSVDLSLFCMSRQVKGKLMNKKAQ
jgi:hypothetical protein